MRDRLGIVVVLALVAGLVGAAPAAADPVPKDATWTEVYFPSGDGTMLHADLFLPKERRDDQRHPVILSIGPYFGSGGSIDDPSPRREGPVLRFNDLITEGRIFERGYAYVQVDSRGYGGSAGCFDLGGAGEQMDAKSAVEWAAEQEWSNGKVGMWGKSYDAWTQVMALAQKPKGLHAAIVQSPLIEAYRGFYMNGVHYEGGWYLTPSLYGTYDLLPPSTADSPPDEYIYPAQGTATNPDCYAEHESMTLVPDKSIPYWQERDIVEEAGKSEVPVLWSHGLLDANTKPDNFLEVFSDLQGPTRAWIGQYDHKRENEDRFVGRDGFMDEAMAWLDHYLKGMPLKRFPRIEVQDNEGKWRTEADWPPSDGKPFRLGVREGSYRDVRGNDASGPGDGLWTFSPPAPYDLHFAGTPRLNLAIETPIPNVNVIALLYDVDPTGEARLITRGAFLVQDGSEVSFDLYPQDWRLRKGHRFGLLLTGGDESWFSPYSTGMDVGVTGGAVTMPFLRYLRGSNLEGFPAAAMGQVPELALEAAQIEEGTVPMKFPPRMTKRPRSR